MEEFTARIASLETTARTALAGSRDDPARRQAAMTAAEEALDELTSTPARMEDRLGQAGFGSVIRPPCWRGSGPLAVTHS
jgi:hypothetical protein